MTDFFAVFFFSRCVFSLGALAEQMGTEDVLGRRIGQGRGPRPGRVHGAPDTRVVDRAPRHVLHTPRVAGAPASVAGGDAGDARF